MKAIQITVDDGLLARIDRDPEVRRSGRSAVFRRAMEAYLRDRRRREIAAAYRRGYAKNPGLGPEWEGWTNEGVWPEE
jgi:metal-responsive CopG/Arc/MetJ family transcriptional regulator